MTDDELAAIVAKAKLAVIKSRQGRLTELGASVSAMTEEEWHRFAMFGAAAVGYGRDQYRI